MAASNDSSVPSRSSCFKEQLLWVRCFRDLEELSTALMDFRNRYNHHWILERLDYRTPVQARRDFQLELEAACSVIQWPRLTPTALSTPPGAEQAAGLGIRWHHGTRSGEAVGRPRAVFRRDEVIALRRQSLSFRQIATGMSVGVGTVRRVLHAAND
jgi:hypothetical protein